MLLLAAGEEFWRKNSDCGQPENCARWKKKGLIGLGSRPSNRDSIEEIVGGSRYLLTLIIGIIRAFFDPKYYLV